jgi:hypothetical protein
VFPIMMRSIASLVLLGCIVLVVGCGSDRGLATVEGTITKNGQPQAGLWVRFAPAEGGRPGNGRTDKKGHYEIEYTYKLKGAHIGANKVAIGTGGEIDGRGNELRPPQQIFAKEIEVTSGANTIDIELTE